MLIYMFGYLPTGPFDLADEDVEGIAIPRTKSRAYKIAVWAGPWGAHQFFLGNSTGRLSPLGDAVIVGSFSIVDGVLDRTAFGGPVKRRGLVVRHLFDGNHG